MYVIDVFQKNVLSFCGHSIVIQLVFNSFK